MRTLGLRIWRAREDLIGARAARATGANLESTPASSRPFEVRI